MIVCATLGADGAVGSGLGRASRVVLASVVEGQVAGWDEHEVGWDRLHDEGTEGAHHARIARFLRDNTVEAVVAAHLGAGMVRMLGTMGIRFVPADGDAREAVARAADARA